jgi:hypothetical protein
VPLEWNILFGYLAVFLFLGFPASAGYGVADMTPGWLALAAAAQRPHPRAGGVAPRRGRRSR